MTLISTTSTNLPAGFQETGPNINLKLFRNIHNNPSFKKNYMSVLIIDDLRILQEISC